MENLTLKMINSWSAKEGCINSTKEILDWVKKLNEKTFVEIKKNSLEESVFWKYDEENGEINNLNKSFFSIKGLKKYKDSKEILQQPIIIQNEIGYLGIICKEINGILHFLMQAKIEPGNVNKIQISPTIQATKSNFQQKHGGSKPKYLEFFLNADKYEIIADQIQSEQSSRFFKKRNRNIIILVGDAVETLPTHKWMTLGQIKELMKCENLVNMDTRTVISCIPYCLENIDEEKKKIIRNRFSDIAFYKSIFESYDNDIIQKMYHYINNCKMFDEEKIEITDLYALDNWHYLNNELVCKQPYHFKVIFCNIKIDGREVREWTQPLFEAVGIAVFGIFSCVDNEVRKFLVKAKKEVGCFDCLELGPAVQIESGETSKNKIDSIFLKKLEEKENVIHDVILSEEGGRFYHEQNRNVIIDVEKEELGNLPDGYFWADFRSLNSLGMVNNCLNIQLRNLLSLLIL